MSALLENMSAHEAAFAERAALYQDYLSGEVSMEGGHFKTDLLRHLAGAIVVKDHRVRYQKEQFDRFATSQNFQPLASGEITLREFATRYAHLIEIMTHSSHSHKCPKIAANYDSFAEDSIKPLNATIFYYFFSSSRQSRTWAQWMISCARFPNDRMRRAYMRFFS